MSDVTQILSQINAGDPSAAEQLLPLVYDELRKLAAHRLAQENPGHTLQATALVHEAYLRLVGERRGVSPTCSDAAHWNSRQHFFAVAASAMRQILVDAARAKRSTKRGGGKHRVPLEDIAAPLPDDELLALDEALRELAASDPLKSRLVELRYFAGLTGDEAADVLGISPSTADRHWTFARLVANEDPRWLTNPSGGDFFEWRGAGGPEISLMSRGSIMIEEQLFHQALELPAEQRARFLEAACAGKPALRQRVEALLEAHANPGSFLQSPPPQVAATLDQPILERPGMQIGPYKLLEQIGEGGMGLVFVAEQHQPVRRKVALKLIKPGMDSREIIARFEAERQALALMDHPNIARVLDAGATPSGRPYFVMELVKGVPITEYCDENRLSPRERLELFTHVCHAVQHAHQKGIIHRDIKPTQCAGRLARWQAGRESDRLWRGQGDRPAAYGADAFTRP